MNVFPIDSVLPQLAEALRVHPAVVLHAPPGAGKTTRVPLALLHALPPGSGRIIMLEPRRIAAASAARWMARSLGEEPGGTVGYTIRFERKVSAKTRIEVVTEGVLTRRIQADPGLEGAALIIFDEFHERSIHADLALALCLDVRTGLREDLKLLVMSATLDTGPLATLLGGAPVVSCGGRAFPVEERYLGEGRDTLPVRIASAVATALRETNGDILAFLPGAGEIRASVQELRKSSAFLDGSVSLHPLYGDLPFEEQERAILPLRDRRKVVLATNIAETSLTIEGVHVVIDSGLTRMLRYDPATGMNRLMTGFVSRASAEQRKGRAGRLGPGVCYRLYGRDALQGMPAFSQPEIALSDLAPLALELAAWGVKDPDALVWLDPPPAAAWASALRLLKELGALDGTGSITLVGREMTALPVHPRLSRMMIRARELGCPRLGADLAALLTERDIFRQSAAPVAAPDPDVAERVDALHRWRRTGDPGPADPAALRSVERTARQLASLTAAARNGSTAESADGMVISRLLLRAFPDRICKGREEGGRVFVHSSGRGVRLSPGSALISSPYLIAVNVDAGEKSEGYMHLAAPVIEDVLRSECAGRIEAVRSVVWDRKERRVTAAAEERIDSLVISSRPFVPTDEEAGPLLCAAIRSAPDMLVMTDDVRQFQARVSLLRKVFPGDDWPDLSDARLFAEPEAWLLSLLSGLRSASELSKLNVLPALKALLTREQAHRIDELAPTAITVPSGSRVRLDYRAGEAPVLAVKLQELFGLADTPRIAAGRVSILLHLLSPARRPVQITQDLKGFWNTGYQQVKKDLKGRYPKHPWPDDPWNALPTARAKPRGR